jgi:hypothetical protein
MGRETLRKHERQEVIYCNNLMKDSLAMPDLLQGCELAVRLTLRIGCIEQRPFLE